MSLVTRGLGSTQLVVTAGLGLGFFLVVETGCVFSKNLDIITQYQVELDVSDLMVSIDVDSEYQKALDVTTEFNKALNVNSEILKTLELC